MNKDKLTKEELLRILELYETTLKLIVKDLNAQLRTVAVHGITLAEIGQELRQKGEQ